MWYVLLMFLIPSASFFLQTGASLFKLDGLNVVAKVSISAGTYTPLIAFSDPCGTSVQRTLQLTFGTVLSIGVFSPSIFLSNP